MNDKQQTLFREPHEPRFNGADYKPGRDFKRLTTQIGRVYDCMKDGKWRSLGDIAFKTCDPEASISAQLRHLRKPRFGGQTVERKHLGAGLYHYRLIINAD